MASRRLAVLLSLMAGGSLASGIVSCESPMRQTPARATSPWLAAAHADVQLPMRADEPTVVVDRRSSMALTFRLVGASPTRASPDPNGLRFVGAAPNGGDVVMRTIPGGVEDFVTLPSAPSTPIRYRIDVQQAAGLRQGSRGLELLDREGVPRLRVLAPWVRDAEGVIHETRAEVVGCAVDRDPRPPWGRAVVPPGAPECEIRIPIPDTVTRFPAVLDPAWLSAAQMDGNRYDHRLSFIDATHPECGDGPFVVVTGGFRLDNDQARRSIEIYHPATDTWCEGPDLRSARARHSATFVDTTGFITGQTMGGPRLVMTGGQAVATSSTSLLATFETLDLVSWTWVGFEGLIYIGRAEHDAIATADSMGEPRVVLVGGTTNFGLSMASQAINPDAFLGLFVDVPDPIHPRAGHSLTAIENTAPFRHLIVGGCPFDDSAGVGGGGNGGNGGGGPQPGSDCSAWELYCPFVDCGVEGDDIPRVLFHGVARGADTVFVSGGLDAAFSPMSAVYGFDREQLTWQALPSLSAPRYGHSASVLADGSLLLAGGLDEEGSYVAEAARLVDGAWSGAGELRVPRATHRAVVLPSGAAMVIGGKGDPDGDTEFYLPCQAHDDCEAGQYCSPDSGACSDREPDGTPCTDPASCTSGFCIEGFCCASGCNDPCRSCAVASAEGSCAERPPTDSPPECLPLASCVDETTFEGANGEVVDCAPYRCRAAACLTVCTATRDCAPGLLCDDRGACVNPPSGSGGEWVCSTLPKSPNRSPWWWLALGLAITGRRANRSRG
jgi:Galactose oxidase, central domain